MITKELIERINWLAYKKRNIGLSEEEEAEQKQLYREYIDAFKANLKAQLDAIEIVDEAEELAEEAEEIIEEAEEAIEETIIDTGKEYSF